MDLGENCALGDSGQVEVGALGSQLMQTVVILDSTLTTEATAW